MCRQLWPFVGLLIFGSIFFWRNPYSARYRKVNGLEAANSEQQKPVHESVVLVGLVVCEIFLLWAACANSLTSLTLSISIISGVYFLLAFALLLIHQFAGDRKYAYDRAVLYCAATYAGCVIVVSYLYQLHAYDSLSDWLEWAGLGRGATWKVLLTHSVVLFVCAFELRLMWRRLMRTSLFSHAHFMQRYYLSSTSSSLYQSLLHLGFLLFLFVYQLVMLHTDKFLVLTLFLAATRYVSVMGAWYIVCALGILLVPGHVFFKSSVVMLSAMVFVLAIFVAQIPLSSFAAHHELFTILGLRLNSSDFGVLVVEHLAVMLMARLYMTTDGWLRDWELEQEAARPALAAVVPGCEEEAGGHVAVESRPKTPVFESVNADDAAVTAMSNGLGALEGEDVKVEPIPRSSQHVIDFSALSTDEPQKPVSPTTQDVAEPASSSPVRSTTASHSTSSSSWVVWLYRGLFVDSSSFFVYCVHLVHYFSFFHLTLIALMVAAYDNASTVFGLAFTILVGLVLLAGQAAIDRWWGYLVFCSTLEVLVKYALSILNLQDDYSCLDECSQWQRWGGHDDHLHDWDVVVFILAGIHYGQLQLQKARERNESQAHIRPTGALLTKGTATGDEEHKSPPALDEEPTAEPMASPGVSADEVERQRLLYVPCPPHHVEVSYYRYDRSVTRYYVHDFTRHTFTSSAVCHFLVFRCLLYLVLFFLISASTTYFNVVQSLYLTVQLALLYLGDSLLERPERARLLLYFQLLVYAVFLLRFLYLIPVFDVATTATAWSTVLGFYHVHEQSPLPEYAVSGVVAGVLYIDIIVMTLLVVQATVLTRPEMVFVRCAIARKRMLAELKRAKAEQRRLDERERTMERLREEQLARVERLHEVQKARLIALPVKPPPASLAAHPWVQLPSPVGSRGAVNSPMHVVPPPTPKPVDERTGVAPPAPVDFIHPEQVRGKVQASTASDDEMARGLGARYTLAALTAHQQEKAHSELGTTTALPPSPASSKAGEDEAEWGQQRGSRYGPPRIIVPPSVLRQQWEAIQRHEATALHPLPNAEFRDRVWLWWRLTHNRVIDFCGYWLSFDRDGWRERKRLIKHRKRQRQHEARERERRQRRERSERRLHRRSLLNSPSDAPLVQVQVTPSAFTAEEVRVVIVPWSAGRGSMVPLESSKPGEGIGSKAADKALEEEYDDPVLQQRRLDWSRSPSWVMQLGQVYRVFVSDASILWICILFFANCRTLLYTLTDPRSAAFCIGYSRAALPSFCLCCV